MNDTTTAAPDSTGSYGPGQRCNHCGTRIDLTPASSTEHAGTWIHDHSGTKECSQHANITNLP